MADINKQLNDLLKSHFLNYNFKLLRDYVSIQTFIREALQFFNRNTQFKTKYPDIYKKVFNASEKFNNTHKENLKSLYKEKDTYVMYQDLFNKNFKKILNDINTIPGTSPEI